MAPPSHEMLISACVAASVELGAYDRRILLWLAGWEPETCVVVAGVITRAHEAGLSAATGAEARMAGEVRRERPKAARNSSRRCRGRQSYKAVRTTGCRNA